MNISHTFPVVLLGAGLLLTISCEPNEKQSNASVAYPFPTHSYRLIRVVDSTGRFIDPASRKFMALYEKIHDRLMADSSYQAYRTDSLRHPIPFNEFRMLGAIEEVIQITRNAEGEEWTEDSIIHTYFDPDNVEAFLVKEVWQWDDGAARGCVHSSALAPLVQLTVEGITLRPFPLYWIDLSRIEIPIGPANAQWMRRYIHYTLLQSIQDPEYDF